MKITKNNDFNILAQDENTFVLPLNWEMSSIKNRIIMEKGIKKYTIPSSKIKSLIGTPVISQSEKFISGYSNELKGLSANKSNPIIVFGDHSCTLKLIDFNFILGGDGTQVFKDKENTHFLYYAIKKLNFLNDGYKRHFSILKEKIIFIPPIVQQTAITSLLSKQEAIVDNLQLLIDKLELQFKYMSNELLSGRIRVRESDDGKVQLYKNTEWKEVEVNGDIKDMPKDWENIKTINFIKKMSEGGTPPSNDSQFYINGTIPWVVIEDIEPIIIKTKKSINKLGLKKIGNNIWVPGDIIMSTGATIGVVGKVGVELSTKQGVSGFTPNIEKITSDYLYYLLKSKKDLFIKMANGSTFKSLTQNQIKLLDFILPPISEQKMICSILTKQEMIIIDKKEKMNQEKKKQLFLQSSLLNGTYIIN